MAPSTLYTIVSVSDSASPHASPIPSPSLSHAHHPSEHSTASSTPCTPPAVPDLTTHIPSTPSIHSLLLPPVPGIVRKPPPCTTDKELEAQVVHCQSIAKRGSALGAKRARVFDFGCLGRRKERPIERGEIVFKAMLVCTASLGLLVLAVLVKTKSTDLPPFLANSLSTFIVLQAVCLLTALASIPTLLKRIRHFAKYFNTHEYLKGLENGEDLTCPHEWQLHFVTAILVLVAYVDQANVWLLAWLAIGKAPYVVVLTPKLPQGTTTFILCAVIELHCATIQILRHLIASQIASSPRR